MKRFWTVNIVIALMWTLLFSIGGAGTAQSPSKLSQDLAALVARGRGDLQPVIVQTQDAPTAGDLAHVQQHGGWVKRSFHHFRGYAAELPLSTLAALSQDARIKRVSLDRPVRAAMAWSNAATRADVAWTTYGVSGAGVGVAVLDTGVYPHEDLNGRIVAWQDYVNSQTSPYDDNGHGTHVAGIIAGDGSASVAGGYSVRFWGVAPGANLIGVKVLDAAGAGVVSDVVAGIDWCIAHKATYNIRVINLSLEHPAAESYTTDPLCQAVERAWQAGIVVVTAAGNRGRLDPNDPNSPPAYMTIDSPGNDPYVITVGATNTYGTLSATDDTITSFSGHAPTRFDHILKPDLVAPGNQVVSLLAPGAYLDSIAPQNEVPAATYSGSGPTRYFVLSGTSVAAPMVAGAAALMIEQDPTLTPDTIKARLMVSANKNVYNRDATPANLFIRGAGQLDVAAALAQTGSILSGAAWSPVITRGLDPGLFYLSTQPFGGSSSGPLWSSSALWSNHLIWGNNVSWADPLQGGDNGLGGDSVLWSDNLIWSDNLPWSDNLLWSDNIAPSIPLDGDS